MFKELKWQVKSDYGEGQWGAKSVNTTLNSQNDIHHLHQRVARVHCRLARNIYIFTFMIYIQHFPITRPKDENESAYGSAVSSRTAMKWN